MELFIFTGLLYLSLTNGQQITHSAGLDPQGNGNCNPYPNNVLNSAECTQHKRDNAAHAKDAGSRDFTDFRILFDDAANKEDATEFLVLEITWMYRYIHCTSQIEAISKLFYDVDPNDLPPSDSPFWQLAYDYLHPGVNHNAPPLGRRRKRSSYSPDDKLAITKIQNIAREPSLGPACVQWLISTYKSEVQNMFHPDNSKFPNPHHYMSTLRPITTTPNTTPSTTPPTTPSTPPSTTPSTIPPTTPSTTPPTTPTIPSTTASATPSTAPPTTPSTKPSTMPSTAVTTDSGGTGGCPASWTPHAGQCYLPSTDKANYQTAKDNCDHLGGMVAVFKTKETQDYLKTLIGHQNYWIGLTDPQQTGQWIWEDSSQLGQYVNWASGHPSNSSNHHNSCGLAVATHQGAWLSSICTHEHAYICQKPSSDPSTTAITTISSPQGCPKHWVVAQNVCYYYSVTDKNWYEAKVQCAQLGGYLAVIKTSQEQDFIKGHSPSSIQIYWIGLSDQAVEGTWLWEDNSLLTNPTNWASNEPNPGQHAKREDCVTASYGPGSAGEWADDICTHKHHFICQKHSTASSSQTTSSPTTSTSLLTAPPSTMTSTASTTLASTPVPYNIPYPVSCWNCTGLECLFSTQNDVELTCPRGEVCFTFMYESEQGRDIERGCMPAVDCKPWSAACEKAEDGLLPWHSTCTYCCASGFCNKPPHLLPADKSALIPPGP